MSGMSGQRGVWVADPGRPDRLRWWDGVRWTGREWPDDGAYTDFVEWFLAAAGADARINRRARLALADRLAGHRAYAAAWHRSNMAYPPAGTPVHGGQPYAQASVHSGQPEPRPDIPVHSGRSSVSTVHSGRARERLGSELAVHGLAYLGVLLLFAGLFGFVTFSFGQVRVGLRPVGEAAIPLVVFGSAGLLGRHGSRIAARALALVGGLLLPVVMLAALADGAPLPPDPAGVALAVTLAVCCVAVAAGYAVAAARRPDTVLRYLVAPVGWLAVGMAALGVRTPVPSGQDIAVPSPGQYAGVLVAVALTLAAVRLRPASRPAVELAAVPALAVAALVEVLALGTAGWPPVPLAVSAAATLLALDLLDRRLPTAAVAIGQAAALAGAVLGLAARLDAGWCCAAGALAAVVLAERAGRRAPTSVAAQAALALAAALLAASAVRPEALAAAALATTGWTHARRHRAAPWLPPAGVLSAVAAVLPPAAAAALVDTLGAGTAVPIAAAAVLAAAALVATLDRGRDPFWRWWLPAAATALVLAALRYAPHTWPHDWAAGWPAAVIGAAAATYALAPNPLPVRLWTAGPALLSAAVVLHPPVGPLATTVAAGALLAASAAARRPSSTLAAHLALLGHLAALAAWPAAIAWSTPAFATPTLGLAILGLAVTALAQETGRAGVPNLLLTGTALDRLVRPAPAALAAALGPLLFVRVLRHAGALPPARLPWQPVVLAATALLYAGVALALAGRYRRTDPAHPWLARPLADVGSLLAAAAGLRAAEVAVAVLERGTTVDRPPALLALAALAALPALLGRALARPPLGWAAALATGPAAIIVAIPTIPGATPNRVLTAWGGLLLVGALTAQRLPDRARPRTAPNRALPPAGPRPAVLPPAVLGASGLVIGLIAAPARDSGAGLTWTWLAGAAVLATAACLLRRAEPAIAAAALATLAGAVAGPGWLALALAVLAAAATTAGWFTPAPVRQACWLAGALTAPAAWAAVLAWQHAGPTGYARSALLAGTVAAAVGTALRLDLDRDFARCWLATSTGSALLATVLRLTAGHGPYWTVASGLAAAAAGAALAAAPLATAALRDAAALLLLAAALTAPQDTPVTAAQLTLAAVAATALLAAALAIAATTRGAAWTRPTLVLGTATTATGIATAHDHRDLLVLALLAAAAHTVAAATALRRPPLLLLVPPWLCAAWLLWASAALHGDVQWLTLPVALALLGTAALRRHALRRDHRPANSPDVTALELSGMALAVAPAYLEAVTRSLGYGFLAALIGAALTVWGAATRVVRRLAVGAATTAGAVLLLVIVPLVPILPGWRAAGPWLLLAAAGLTTVLAATALDAGRRAVRTTAARLSDLTAGWERS